LRIVQKRYNALLPLKQLLQNSKAPIGSDGNEDLGVARASLLDSLPAIPGALDLAEWDSQKLRMEAPIGTPTPLREVYAALANAVFQAWQARYKPTFDSQVAFREAIAVPLSDALKTAGTILDQNKIWLRAKASEAFDAFLAVMEEVRDINYACGHVMLGQVEGSPTAYLLSQRPFNAYSLIDRMERATCIAAHRLS
jgi:hypothetical protein